MRLSTSALWTATAIGILAACSGNTEPTPLVPAPLNAGTSSVEMLRVGMPAADAQRPLRAIKLIPGKNVVVALQTSDDTNYVTAVDEKKPEPNCTPGTVALHDNATSIGPDEKFTPVYNSSTGQYAFQFSNDGVNFYYITAVNGGGIGGPNGKWGYSQLHTDATSVGSDEKFQIVWINNNTQIAFRVPREHDGTRYLTAFGGCGGPSNVPFHTDAKTIGTWEEFTLFKE